MELGRNRQGIEGTEGVSCRKSREERRRREVELGEYWELSVCRVVWREKEWEINTDGRKTRIA